MELILSRGAVYGERPKVEVRCDFSYTLKLPATAVDRTIVTVPEVFAGALTAPVRAVVNLARGGGGG